VLTFCVPVLIGGRRGPTLSFVTKRRGRGKRAEEWVDYRLRPTAWWSNYSAYQQQGRKDEEPEVHSGLYLDFDVELIEPVKGVSRGRFSVASDLEPTRWGITLLQCVTPVGSKEQVLSATAWISETGVLGLLALVAGGREVEFSIHGHPFQYRRALARSFSWHTADHPAKDDM
jgi:hypothetical protein